MKYVYFVVYWHTDGGNASGFGNVEVVRSAPVTSYDAIAEVQTMLEAQGGRGVVVLSVTLLRIDNA